MGDANECVYVDDVDDDDGHEIIYVLQDPKNIRTGQMNGAQNEAIVWTIFFFCSIGKNHKTILSRSRVILSFGFWFGMYVPGAWNLTYSSAILYAVEYTILFL